MERNTEGTKKCPDSLAGARATVSSGSLLLVEVDELPNEPILHPLRGEGTSYLHCIAVYP